MHGVTLRTMLPDRVLGLLSLGLAAALATWGGPGAGDDPGAGAVRPASSEREAVAASTSTTGDPPGSDAAPAGRATGATTTTTAAPGESTTSTAPAPREAASAEPEDAQARRILLGPEDLPSGFVVVRQPSGEAAGADGPFERCLGPDAAALTAAVRAKARSPEYGRSGTGTVSSSAAVFGDPVAAEKVMTVLRTPSARTCFEDLINARLARNPNLPEDARGTLTPIDAGALGDGSTGFRFEVHLPAEDVEEDPTEEEIPYLADFVFIRRGRALALLEFGSLRRPFPAGDIKSIASHLAARM